MLAHLGIIVVTSAQRLYLFVEKGTPSSLPLAWQALATLTLVTLSIPMSPALDAARTLPDPECILEAEVASSGQQGGCFLMHLPTKALSQVLGQGEPGHFILSYLSHNPKNGSF